MILLGTPPLRTLLRALIMSDAILYFPCVCETYLPSVPCTYAIHQGGLSMIVVLIELSGAQSGFPGGLGNRHPFVLLLLLPLPHDRDTVGLHEYM
jgi:hypothetical protein